MGDVSGEKLVVDKAEVGLRLDKFLVHRELLPSMTVARRAITSGALRVNGRVAKKGYFLRAGDVVQFEEGSLGNAPAVPVPAPDVPLSVLYVDDTLVAIDKPSGLACHPLRAGDGPTVAGALLALFPECAQASPDPREGGLAHRLDVGTSGVLLAARSPQAWGLLREALATPFCEKIYLAEVRGKFPAFGDRQKEFIEHGPYAASFVVTAPIGRRGRRGGKVKLASGRQPLPARTCVTLFEPRQDTALVEARLARGRAHQVRAHLAYLGIPVVGDAVYGSSDTLTSPPLRLHARAVSFVHPISGSTLRIEAPLPPWARRRT